MKESFVVNAESRADRGKGASRRLRHAGKVPAIVYGGKDKPEELTLNHREMAKHLETEAFYSHILTLKIDGKEQQAVLKDIQRHPAKPVLMHFDFQRIYADQIIHMHVPLHFKGAELSPGVKLNAGVVEHYEIQVEVQCLPKDLPEFFEIDMSKMDLNDTIRMSQIALPPGVALSELKHKNDVLLAAIHPPRAIVEETTIAEVPAGEVPATSIKPVEAAPAAGGKAGDSKAGGKPGDSKPGGKDAKPAAKPDEKKK